MEADTLARLAIATRHTGTGLGPHLPNHRGLSRKKISAVVESAIDAIRTACVEPNHRGLSRKKDECCGGVSIALGCEWNVLNGLDYHYRPPCLRGARLAETNDGNRLEPFRVDVTSLALASLRSRSGKPLEPSFHHLGRPK
jgi:hypothetical protein